MAIKIEKGIPIPLRKGALSEEGAALAALEVGDSFVVALKKDGNNRLGGKFAYLRPKRFTQRRIDDDTVRIWRVQ